MTWHVAHAILRSALICSSKKSALPSWTFAVVTGLPVGTGTCGKAGPCAPRVATPNTE
jgi:hypothetical protein